VTLLRHPKELVDFLSELKPRGKKKKKRKAKQALLIFLHKSFSLGLFPSSNSDSPHCLATSRERPIFRPSKLVMPGSEHSINIWQRKTLGTNVRPQYKRAAGCRAMNTM
jgi:hypothetical protein